MNIQREAEISRLSIFHTVSHALESLIHHAHRLTSLSALEVLFELEPALENEERGTSVVTAINSEATAGDVEALDDKLIMSRELDWAGSFDLECHRRDTLASRFLTISGRPGVAVEFSVE